MILFNTTNLSLASFGKKLKSATESDAYSIYENCNGQLKCVSGDELDDEVIRAYSIKNSPIAIYNADGLHDDKQYQSRFVAQIRTSHNYNVVLSKKIGNAYSQLPVLQNIIDTIFDYQEKLKGAE